MCILYLIVYNFTRFRCAENHTPQDLFMCAVGVLSHSHSSKDRACNLTLCDCGQEPQVMNHFLQCPLLEEACAPDDLAQNNQRARNCVQQLRGSMLYRTRKKTVFISVGQFNYTALYHQHTLKCMMRRGEISASFPIAKNPTGPSFVPCGTPAVSVLEPSGGLAIVALWRLPCGPPALRADFLTKGPPGHFKPKMLVFH